MEQQYKNRKISDGKGEHKAIVSFGGLGFQSFMKEE